MPTSALSIVTEPEQAVVAAETLVVNSVTKDTAAASNAEVSIPPTLPPNQQLPQPAQQTPVLNQQ